MKLIHPWQSGTAFTLAIAMTTSVLAPLGLARSALAVYPYRTGQVFPPSWRTNPPRTYPERTPNGWGYQSSIPSGSILYTTYDKEKIVVTPTETADITLTVANDVRSTGGAVVIPAGSEIAGQLRPTSDGTQFFAEELILDNGDRYPIAATSDILTRRETISSQSDPKIFQGVAIGAVAASILGELFGKVELWQVLGGAGVGALGSLLIRDRKQVEVISINPDTDLNLRLQSAFDLRPR